MKYVLAIGLSLLAGVLAGVLSQRAPLQRAEDRIQELEARDCSGGKGLGRGLAAAMHGQPVQMVEPEERSTPEPFEEETPVDPEAAALADELDRAGEEAREELADGVDDVQADLELLMTAQDLRRSQARAALVEQADPTDEELATFDEAMAAMNEDLLSISREFVDGVEDIEDVPRRDLMVFAADVLDVMIEAESAADQAMPGVDLAAVDDEAIDPFSYIDPSILEVLVELDR